MNGSRDNKKVTVAIIGGGPAGISSAIWCKRLGMVPLLFEEKERIGGALHQIHGPLIDYPGRWGKNGEEFLHHLEEHLHLLQIPVHNEEKVTSLEMRDKGGSITTEMGLYEADYVILATGTRPRRLHIPGEEEMFARGEIYSTHRNREALRGKRVLIVGGGDRAVETALNLLPYAEAIHLVHRREHFRARSEWMGKLRESKVLIHTNTRLKAILGEGKVEGALLSTSPAHEQLLPVDAVLIRIGNEPVVELIPPSLRKGNGAPHVDENGATRHPRLFAVGDLVTPPPFCSIAVAVGQGMRAAKQILEQEKEIEQRERPT
ncbi:NAD(P)/FAD-dependent oxidoreductase [Thermicanus aegyptius]|uniref:NAD(P)/FAD-dependent oxidoreductase n=1 Tax=Thermicanus aegyptius TaxID=94009 RepID=UPI000401E8CC|nr:NAD(P)/FAD-dependent oxidoreductase [Thermicanus aegyptius]